jgi:hypothetical protein
VNPGRILAVFVAYPRPESETNGRLLVESIRAFGGRLSGIALWCLAPQVKRALSSSFCGALKAAGVELHPFRVDSDMLRFPLAADVEAAAHAEAKAAGRFGLLAWLGANTLVLREPGHFILPRNKQAGYCPVHHVNIGPATDQPLAPFWTRVYQACRVPPDRLFSMETHVDARTVRAYFNATSLVVRPDRGLFRAWQGKFFGSYRKAEFLELYKMDERYPVFMHQAMLASVILAMFDREDLVQLPGTYNYPLHLWQQDITGTRPQSLDELVTVRHEGFYNDAHWRKKMPEGSMIKDWLEERIRPVVKKRP